MLWFYTAPSAGPASITAATVTNNSITVQWEEVPCIHRNGEITGYTVVARNSDGEFVAANTTDGNVRETSIILLDPSTLYTVSVVAVNEAGTGPATTIHVKTAGEYN